MLYQHTGDPQLLEVTKIITESLIALQWKDGRWTFSDPGTEKDVPATSIDATVEIALWLHCLKGLF
jgi:hypothetical protein